MIILKLTIRIYRTHDFDLMALHQTGALKIGAAMKKAILAYYNGEKFSFDIAMPKKPDLADMPLVVATSIVITEKDAEGITKWLSGFLPGYRNCCLKNLLRHFLPDPAIAYFRNDGEYHELLDLGMEKIVCRPQKSESGPRGSQWLTEIAKQKPKEKDPRQRERISHALDHLDPTKEQVQKEPYIDETTAAVPAENSGQELADPSVSQEPIPDMPLDHTEEVQETEDDDFDAFAAFEDIVRGG